MTGHGATGAAMALSSVAVVTNSLPLVHFKEVLS